MWFYGIYVWNYYGPAEQNVAKFSPRDPVGATAVIALIEALGYFETARDFYFISTFVNSGELHP